jgi:pantoate--beta-alanine ligase
MAFCPILILLVQFAVTEDISRYPRTLQKDLDLLGKLVSTTAPTSAASQSPRAQLKEFARPEDQSGSPSMGLSPSLIVFAPEEDVMYPLKGELQDLAKHRGVTVEMKGYGEVLEGVSRRECADASRVLHILSTSSPVFQGGRYGLY